MSFYIKRVYVNFTLILRMHFCWKIGERLSDVSRVTVESRFPRRTRWRRDTSIPFGPVSRRHAASLHGYSANYRSTAVDVAARVHVARQRR